MSITYGPSGSSFVVRLGGRVVQRARTEAGAEAAAVRLSAQFGGEVMRDEPAMAAVQRMTRDLHDIIEMRPVIDGEVVIEVNLTDALPPSFKAGLHDLGTAEWNPVILAVEPVVEALGIDTPPDFHAVLDLSIGKLRERLAVGDLDEHLVALDAAERQGKTRTGALAAIADRRKARTTTP